MGHTSPAFPRIKVLNEAAFIKLAEGAGVPVPTVIAYCEDAKREGNEIGYEWIMMESEFESSRKPQTRFLNQSTNTKVASADFSRARSYIGIMHKSLADTYHLLSSSQLERVLEQLVDLFIRLYNIDLDRLVVGGRRIGGLTIEADDGSISVGQVLEETMWQV